MKISLSQSGWSQKDLDQYLEHTKTPLRLACINSRGYPAIVPLWFEWDGTHFWCATHQKALLLDYLRSSPRVGFEIANNEPPYYGVRGQGEIELLPAQGENIIERLLQKYLAGVDNRFTRWLISRRKEEVAIKLYPHTLSVWDYRKRMQGED